MIIDALERNEKSRNYPTIRAILDTNFSKDYTDIGKATIEPEEKGGLSYGFHVTLPGSQKPDLFLSISDADMKKDEDQPIHSDNTSQSIDMLNYMQTIYSNARNKPFPKLDSSKLIPNNKEQYFIATNNTELLNYLSEEPGMEGLTHMDITLQTHIEGKHFTMRNDDNPTASNNLRNYAPDIVENVVKSLARLHKTGQQTNTIDYLADISNSVGDGSIFRKKHDEFIDMVSTTERSYSQNCVINKLDSLANEVDNGNLQKLYAIAEDFSQLPTTKTAHKDPNMSNFLQLSTSDSSSIRGEEHIAIIDMDTLSHAPRIYDISDILSSSRIYGSNPGEESNDPNLVARVVRAYEEVADTPLTDIELNYAVDYIRYLIILEQTLSLATITPENFRDDDLEGYISMTWDTESTMTPEIIQHIVTDRSIQAEKKHTLNALDLETPPQQMERIDEHNTPFGRAAAGQITNESLDNAEKKWRTYITKNTPTEHEIAPL